MKRTFAIAALALGVIGTPALADTAQEELQPRSKRIEATSYQQPRAAFQVESIGAVQSFDFLTQYNP
jgi:hypothetical protein